MKFLFYFFKYFHKQRNWGTPSRHLKLEREEFLLLVFSSKILKIRIKFGLFFCTNVLNHYKLLVSSSALAKRTLLIRLLHLIFQLWCAVAFLGDIPVFLLTLILSFFLFSALYFCFVFKVLAFHRIQTKIYAPYSCLRVMYACRTFVFCKKH